MSDPVKITASPTTDPLRCDFQVDRPLLEEGAWFFSSAEDAAGSAVPRAVLALPEVSGVLVHGAKVTVHRTSPEGDWMPLARQVGAAIRSALATGEPPVDPELAKKTDAEDGLKKRVEAVLEAEVNPMVASHGGWIEVVDVRGQDLHLRMGGGCQGCGSAVATLRQGVERLLRERLPELGSIHDATDHASGENPFFAPQGS